MIRSATRIVLLGLFLVTGAVPGAVAADPPLQFGILPFATPEKLVDQFRHLAGYLEQHLERRVDILSAPDYRAFFARTAAGQYDLVFTPPHFAALAVDENGYVPLVKTDPPISPTIFVRRSGGIAALADLSGKTVAAPDRFALVTILYEEALRREAPNKSLDTIIYYTPTLETALELVARGVVDAAVAIPAVAQRMPAEVQDRLAPLLPLRETFAMTYLAAARIPAPDRDRLRALLLAFPETVEGVRFRQGAPTPTHTVLTVEEIRPYLHGAPELKARLSRSARN